MMENKVEKMDHLIQGYWPIQNWQEAIVRENVDTWNCRKHDIIHIPKHITITIKKVANN
jgi:hypothetical protein